MAAWRQGGHQGARLLVMAGVWAGSTAPLTDGER